MIRPARPSDSPDLHAIWTPVIRETTSIFHTPERTPEEIAANPRSYTGQYLKQVIDRRGKGAGAKRAAAE